jgi:hypothetical protein
MKLFDKYSFKAMYLPTMIILVSPIINVYLVVFALDLAQITEVEISLTDSSKVFTSLIPILLYFVALAFVRTSGRSIQRKLIKEWRGFPSTRFLKYRDNKFSIEMKQNLGTIIKDKYKITLLKPQEETKDPYGADKRISTAFALIKDWLRQNDEKAFWQIHNTDYGFYRNLLGGSKLWITFNVICLIISLVLYLYVKSPTFLFLIILNTVITAVSISVIILYLPSAVKFSAEQYAEAAWTSFYNLNQE